MAIVWIRSMVNRGLLVEEGFGRGKKYMAICYEDSNSGLDFVSEETKGNNLENTEVNLVNSKLNDIEREIVNIIKDRGFTTNKINTETLGISSYKSVRYCNNLIEKGAIKKEGKGRNVRHTLVN